MKIYMDTCCYNRPFDNQSQDRIHDESNAVLSIIRRCEIGKHKLLGSTVLKMEIDNITDSDRKKRVSELYSVANEEIKYSDAIKDRAYEIRDRANIQNMDSLHLASAEIGGADIFLTTDDKLIKAASNLNLKIRTINPINCLAEVITNE